MPKVWTGAKVLILGGAVAAGTVAAVASGMFDSSDSPEGRFPGEPAGVAAEEAGGSGDIDYNCNRPGKGRPWLQHRALEPPLDYVGDAPPALFWSPLGTDIEIIMPVERSPDGSVDYAEVYEKLCRVHPDLGGTEARELTTAEKHMLSDLGVDSIAGRAVPFWERGCHITATDLDFTVITSYTAYDSRFNPRDYICEPDDDPPGLDGREVEGRWDRSWEGFYTDAGSNGQLAGVYWLPPIPQGWLDELASAHEAEGESESTHEAEEEDRVTWQRWRIELVGDELVDLNPLLRGAPGARQGVGFHYEVTAEFTLEKQDDGWVYRSGHITSANITNSLHYEPEGDWDVAQMDCFGSDDYSRVVSGRLESPGVIWLQWPTHSPNCVVFACHRSRDCYLEDPASSAHHHESGRFFEVASDMFYILLDGRGDETEDREAIGEATHRVIAEGEITLLDQH